jgi:hypothetical protein
MDPDVRLGVTTKRHLLHRQGLKRRTVVLIFSSVGPSFSLPHPLVRALVNEAGPVHLKGLVMVDHSISMT